MNIIKERAIIRILNKTCSNPEIPSYNHIEIKGIRHSLKQIPQNLHFADTDKTYLEMIIIVSGTSYLSKGNMPNPMVDTPIFDLVDFELI